ncbi:MAG: hypothetical protein J6Q53_00795 [Oscillospiraceae bacterium]|nr:hypothetical protein [Oscillospiraceae bacterium]
MEWVKLKEKLPGFLKKYRYAALVLVIGVVLMLLPSGTTSKQPETNSTQTVMTVKDLQERLAVILSQVEGAGQVQVMLSEAAGEETLYQTNDDYSTGNDTATTRKDTVTVTDAQRNETGLVRQVNPPRYLGAVIVCQGAENPTVRLAIAEAVSKATGLGVDKISILKMK